ncbi:hypothetical protein JYU34_018191 [Plutella xylostella]|uniref:RING-type E3 ubiquitin transferase n=1 Tax=Plutella xylostella TaxID=51655 RepID=A0ABQ7Q011_PLUXY|nr:hypothetical protein JYU34_018191 [Plutella xylostella]
MSGQEPEDDSNRKRSGPSRGLALAATATAVGIGFGAAIYYMFKKREASEAANSTQPASAGATSADWTAEDQCALDDALRENERRAREFRTRAWSAEECSICCEVMLDTHPLIDLDCSHRFHQECIRPWLRMEKPATCPNCRKRIEICELETIT